MEVNKDIKPFLKKYEFVKKDLEKNKKDVEKFVIDLVNIAINTGLGNPGTGIVETVLERRTQEYIKMILSKILCCFTKGGESVVKCDSKITVFPKKMDEFPVATSIFIIYNPVMLTIFECNDVIYPFKFKSKKKSKRSTKRIIHA